MLPYNYYKILLIIFTIISVQFQAQDYSFLPEPIRINIEYQNRGNYNAALEFNLKTLKYYKENNNTEGVATIYTNMANMLFIFSRYKESFHYLDKAKDELDRNRNPLLNGRLYIEYGKNYTSLGLYKQSNTTFNNALKYINRIHDKKQRSYYLNVNYTWKRNNFLQLRQMDSVRGIENKSFLLKQNILVYTRKADYFIANRVHLDSAEYYLNKALSSNKSTDTIDVAVTWFSYGDLYTVKKDHEKALKYYLKSLQILEKIRQSESIKVAYDSISSTYKSLNNIEKSNEYLRKYTDLSSKIEKQEKAAINTVINKLLEVEKKEKNEDRNRLYVLIVGITIISLSSLYFIRKAYLKKQKKKDELIEQQIIETRNLEKRVNSSFNEVIQLAKEGDPFFITRFKEVYPDFYEKLMEHSPNLTNNDIKLSAYLRLNLSSKEIANFENLTSRTVETKKYRLKKRLGLDSEIDLFKWINDM